MPDKDLEQLKAEVQRLFAAAATAAGVGDAQDAQDELVALEESILAMLAESDRAHLEHLAALREALRARDVVGQAKGLLMAATGCTADEAFALLVAQSQATNRKVVEIAAELAARASGLGRPSG